MNKELAYKLVEFEHKIEKHDEDIQTIFDAIRRLMARPPVSIVTLVKPPELLIQNHSP